MSDAAIRIEPFFLDSPRGPLFCLYLAPSHGTPREGILYLHPFAEEMHKSRRMTALQARAFAARGYAVLQVDLTGCGDSAGDFGDATWDAWREDARLAHDWLSRKAPDAVTLWGLRTGAMLAVDVSRGLPNVQSLLLWQPVLNGEQFLTQFLRIKLASEMLSGNEAQTGTKDLCAALDAGQPIEVGGYLLAPAMAQALTKLKLSELQPRCPVDWIEIGAKASEEISPAGRRVADIWRGLGVEVISRTVQGEPFWITQEIAECPALVQASLTTAAPSA